MATSKEKKNIDKKLWRNLGKTANQLKYLYEKYEYFVVFDTETTGLHFIKDRIIQLSAIKVDRNFVELDRFDEYINPYPILISPKITELTGISMEQIENAPNESEVIPKFNEFSENCGFIAYNSDFDFGMITEAFKRVGIEREIEHFDVREIAYDMVSDSKDFKLKTVCERLKLIENENFHNSMFDVEMTLKIIQKFYIDYLNFTNIEKSKAKVKVYALNPWSIGKNRRLYVPTSNGTFYYDMIKKNWGEKDGSIDSVNMEDIEKQAINLANKKGYPSLANVKESVFYRDL